MAVHGAPRWRQSFGPARSGSGAIHSRRDHCKQPEAPTDAQQVRGCPPTLLRAPDGARPPLMRHRAASSPGSPAATHLGHSVGAAAACRLLPPPLQHSLLSRPACLLSSCSHWLCHLILASNTTASSRRCSASNRTVKSGSSSCSSEGSSSSNRQAGCRSNKRWRALRCSSSFCSSRWVCCGVTQQDLGAARAGCSQAGLCACCLPWPCSAHCASRALGCRVCQLACCMHKPHGLL